MKAIKYFLLGIGALVLLWIIAVVAGNITYPLTSFYKDCRALSSGMTEKDYKVAMGKYIDNPKYTFIETDESKGVFGNEYDKSLSLATESGLRMKTSRCLVYLKNDKVADVTIQ